MDIILLLIFIPLCLLFFFLVLISLLYAFPVHVSLSCVSEPQRKERAVSICWLMVCVRRSYTAGMTQTDVLVARHILRSSQQENDDDQVRAREPAPSFEPDNLPQILLLMPLLAGPVVDFCCRLFRLVSIDSVRGTMRIGLADPVCTGMVYGWYCAVRPLLAYSRIFLEITPVFDRNVCDMELEMRWDLRHPLMLAISAWRLYRNRDVQEALSIMKRNQAEPLQC
jgi:hypothetical protein